MVNKQTAVDYLWNDLIANPGNYIKAYQKAKEMEKEQKQNMFNCGRQYQLTGEGTFKEVYEEIYGKK
jgi:hypothetical protein